MGCQPVDVNAAARDYKRLSARFGTGSGRPVEESLNCPGWEAFLTDSGPAWVVIAPGWWAACLHQFGSWR